MSDKNEPCIPERNVHVWPDEGDMCKCGARNANDAVMHRASVDLTIMEKLERMKKDRLLRGMLSVEDVQELMENREAVKMGDVDELRRDLDSFGFPDVEPGERYFSRRLRHGIRLALVREAKFIEVLDELGARPGGTPEERLRELVTRTQEMRTAAEKKCGEAQREREAMARCPGRERGGLWEELFMFYLPRCYDAHVEAPTEAARLEARVTAAVRMANDAFRIAWEKRA